MGRHPPESVDFTPQLAPLRLQFANALQERVFPIARFVDAGQQLIHAGLKFRVVRTRRSRPRPGVQRQLRHEPFQAVLLVACRLLGQGCLGSRPGMGLNVGADPGMLGPHRHELALVSGIHGRHALASPLGLTLKHSGIA